MEKHTCVLGAVEEIECIDDGKSDAMMKIRICNDPPENLRVFITYDTAVVRDYFLGYWWNTYYGEYELKIDSLIWRNVELKVEFYEEPDDVVYFLVRKEELVSALGGYKEMKTIDGKLVENE